jgi:hypothetical protein
MPNIYLADDLYYIVATDAEKAAYAYTDATTFDASTMTKTVDTAYVVVATEDFTFTAVVSPSPAIADGGLIYPASGTVKAGSDQVFTAVDGSTYSFVQWQDESAVLISTDNPATINIDENAKGITALFSL